MKKYLPIAIIMVLISSNIYFYLKSKNIKHKEKPLLKAATVNTTESNKLNYAVPSYEINTEMKRIQNTEYNLKQFSIKNKCNQDYAFVIDMRLPSYKKRFFVYNLKKDSIIANGFVAHGTGSETFKGELVFSNVPDSRCTSLGKYKIGGSYKGMYGFSYKLTGLDSTNNKAFERAIVLHGHSCVPDEQTNDWPICFSYGCPMVSPNFLQKLKGYISKQGKTPILMEIIY